MSVVDCIELSHGTKVPFNFYSHMSRFGNGAEIFNWNGQLVWTPAVGLYLCVYPGVDPRHIERRVT